MTRESTTTFPVKINYRSAAITVFLALALSACERPGAGEWNPGTGGPVPGIESGMTPAEVADEIGSPTSTETKTFEAVQVVESMTSDLETLIYRSTTTMPPNSTLRVQIDTWTDVQRWPWQSSRTWEVAYRQEEGVWRAFTSFDKKENVVIG